MGVTDCHVHINPLWEMRPEARSLLGAGGEALPLEEYVRRPDRFLEYLDRCRVDRAVLVNYVSPDVVGYTERTNDFVSEYARADPERLIAVGGISAQSKRPEEEMHRLVQRLGLRGLKLHPPHQLVAPNGYVDGSAPALRKVYEACERFEIPLIVHTGTSVFPRARNRFGQPLLIEDVAIDFPRLTIVLAHGGRPLWTEEAFFLARRFPRVYLELSSIPPARLLEYFPQLDRIPDKVLFGTDWPGPGVTDIGRNVEAFRRLPLAPEMIHRILSENPERVFPRRTT